MDWPVADRRRLEQPLVQRYHDQLVAHGITGYSLDQVWTDCRLTSPVGMYIAVEYNRGGLNTDGKFVWLPHLGRTLTACDDLECSNLW